MKERLLKILLIVLLLLSSFPHVVFANEENGNEFQSFSEGETLPENDDADEETPILTDDSKTDEDAVSNKENVDPEIIDQNAADLLTKNEETKKKQEEEKFYERTILMYAVGSDLESLSGLCSFNLKQILNSEFSKDDKIKFIVMTGGADENDGWHMEPEYLYDPNGQELEKISTDYNCIWEAKGKDAIDNPGKLVLLDGDGVLGDGDDALPAAPSYDEYGQIDESQDYEFMSDPEVLKAFINYGYDNYPAEEYDIIFWDHGSGIYSGFGKDEHSDELMMAGDMADAICRSNLYQDNKRFSFINFDACMMSSIELMLIFAPYTHYYIASPEVIPGNGEYYTGWLNMLGKDPDIDNYDLGKKIVDDYYDYYQNSGESDMDATLALIDTDLLTSEEVGFVDALMELNEIMVDQLFKLQVYDELTAITRSITYGDNKYYVDFGNLVSQLCVASKEIEEGVPSGGKDLEVNEYYDVAEKIMNALNDERIIYNCCTNGIHTIDEIMYREFRQDGQIKFADDNFPLYSSGIYMFFEPVERKSFREYEYYGRNISYSIQRNNDSAIKFLSQDAQKVICTYLDTIRIYALLIQTGKTITQMVDEGYEKEDINFEAVLKYWHIPIIEDSEYSYSNWDFYVREMFNNVYNYMYGTYGDLIPDDNLINDPKLRSWMEKMVEKMVEEAIDKDCVELYEVISQSGTGYRVVMNEVKKRVIDKVAYELLAEFPILEQYIEENDLAWIFAGQSHKDIEVPIGSISGSELFDMDLEQSDDFINDYIEWLNGNTSTWDLDSIEEKWYALKDEEGNFHAVAVEEDKDYLLVPMRRQVEATGEDGDEELVDEMVALFFKGEDLISFMIKEDGAYRPMAAKDLKTELKLESCLPVSTFVGRLYLPISTEMVINPENVDQIKLTYTDIDNIPDIADTTDDGEKLTKRIVIYNIYGEKIDITDMVNSPVGILKDISEAIVLDDVYTGEILSPRILFEGNLLKEGVDYKLIKATDEDIYLKTGEYRFFIQGIGAYVGGVLLIYNITPYYTILDGANGIFKKGDKYDLIFRFTRSGDDENTFEHFTEILIDGKKIDPSMYEASEGSLIIALKSSYLETLESRDHTITAVFDDGQSKAVRFIVMDKNADNKKDEKKVYVLPETGIE